MEPEGAYITPEGYIRAKAVVTRAGVFSYANADGSERKELRLPEDVFHSDAISTMRLIPVTNGHPHEKLVTAENAKRLAVGFTGDIVEQDGDHVLANLVITDAETVKIVKEQGRRELSLGYTVDLIPQEGEYNGERYDYKQTNIRYNHLALVDNARAGSAARIKLDGDDAVQIDGEKVMANKRKIKIDAIDYMVDEPVAAYIERSRDRDKDGDVDSDDHVRHLEDNVRNLTDELERVRRELDMQKDELERARKERDMMAAERDSMKTAGEMDSKDMMKKDSADFHKAVSERVKLIKTASAFLPNSEIERLDNASSMDIKKAVIKASKKHINLDGKSDVYTETMFDFIVADAHLQPILTNVQMGIKSDSRDQLDPDQARKAMIERDKASLKKVKS
jgi:hypothetical protein